jgi:biopolymer transport protein ExbB
MGSVFEFVQHGGIMMYPLVLCSVVLVAIILERAIILRRNSTDPDELLDDVKAAFKPGADPAEAIRLAVTRGAIGRIFARALRNAGRSDDAIEMALEQEAANEAPTP